MQTDNTQHIKIELFKGNWTAKTAQENLSSLFIYGDNDKQYGKKGQAVIRDEPNSSGIPTKKMPSYNQNAYYTDLELEENKKKIEKSIKNIKEKLRTGLFQKIVFSEDGIGTGLADLKNKAPLTYLYLQEKIKKLCECVENNSF